ncbi:YbaN family protein [Planctomycetota bacterium]|nr:YbaN family protein [Planctomycetota bacterium]
MRVLFAITGLICAGLGLLGVFLPLLPTTPLLLAAAWCFARSSKRLDAWLENHPHLGPPLAAWREHGAVPLRAKVAAACMLSTSLIWAVGCPVSGVPLIGQVLFALVAAGVLVFLLTRPSLAPVPVEGNAR